MKQKIGLLTALLIGSGLSPFSLQALKDIYHAESLPINEHIKARLIYSWKESSPVKLEELRYLRLSYWGFDNAAHEGELIVHALVADDIMEIFETLFKIKFPIERMELVDAYEGNDNQSMNANNCYAHCTRYVSHSTNWSNHAFGLAIDINPQHNPYITSTYVCPEEGGKLHTDRTVEKPGMITPQSVIYQLFKSKGWEWGGECFIDCQDLHHFQKIIPNLNKTEN